MGVKFDADAAIRALAHALREALRQLQEEYLHELQYSMSTEKGRESLYAGDVNQSWNYIEAEVIGGAWAVMDAFGTGSAMDITNPALRQYMESELWNTYRQDLAISGRPAGDYTDIFGETRHSSGRMVGRNLENVPGGKFKPQTPSHAFELAKRWMEAGRAQEVVQSAVNSIPWHTFFVEVRGHCGGR